MGTLRTEVSDVISVTLIGLWNHLSFRRLTILYIITKSAAVNPNI